MRKLNVIGVLGAVLLLAGSIGLAACPPGSRNLNDQDWYDVGVVAGTAIQLGVGPVATIVEPGTYCVPQGGITDPVLVGIQDFTIASSDVVIVGETPSARLLDDIPGNPPGIPITITINAGLMNVVLRSFTTYENIFDNGAYMLLIDGVTMDDGILGADFAFTSAIVLQGFQPEVRNCTFRMSNSLGSTVIALAGGMNARIHGNRVVGTSDPAPLSFVATTVNYNGLEVRNNRANMIGSFVIASPTLAGVLGTLTNSVIEDNTATIYGAITAGPGMTFGILVEGANIDIKGNTLTVGNYQPNVSAGVGALIGVLGTNVTVSGNILDASLGLDDYTVGVGTTPCAAILTLGTNTTITGNTVLGVKNGPAIAAFTFGPFTGINAVITNNTIREVVDARVFAPDLADFDYDGDGNAEGAAIYIYAINAEVTGNTIDGVYGADSHGIMLAMGNAEVAGNTIKNVEDGAGVFVLGSMNNEIQNNTLQDIGQDGILLAYNNLVNQAGFAGVGVPTYSDNNTVTGNTLERVAILGVVDLPGQNPAVGDPLWGDYAGIRLNAASNNLISGNTLNDPGGMVWPAWICGIDLAQRVVDAANNPLPPAMTMNNTIVNNQIGYYTEAGNIGSSALGILVQAGMNHLVQGNLIENTGNMQLGIDIRTPDRMTVQDNEVKNMMYAGMYLRGGTVTNRLTVEGNEFHDNYIGIALSAGAANMRDNIVKGGRTALLVDRFGVAGQFVVEQNCFTASILVNNIGTGRLTARRNYWGVAPVQGTTIRGDVDFSEALDVCPGDPTPPVGIEHTYGPASGWYMVSVPTTGDTRDIFGVTMYRYNPGIGDYETVTTLRPAEGYWARLSANKQVTALGTVPTSDVTVALGQTGWHQISAPWQFARSAIRVTRAGETLSWADAVAAGWVRNTIYAWTPNADEYTMPTMLQPWYAYWVRAYEDGVTLRFNYAARAAAAGLCVSCQAPAPLALSVPSDLPGKPQVAEVAAGALAVSATPNPLSGGAVSFQVAGPLASDTTEIKVQVMDVSGRAVFDGSAVGAQLSWNAEGVANGVYLFQVTAKVAGSWVTSGYEKLLIVR